MKKVIDLDNGMHVKALVLNSTKPKDIKQNYWRSIRKRARDFGPVPKKILEVLLKQHKAKAKTIYEVRLPILTTEGEAAINKINYAHLAM